MSTKHKLFGKRNEKRHSPYVKFIVIPVVLASLLLGLAYSNNISVFAKDFIANFNKTEQKQSNKATKQKGYSDEDRKKLETLINNGAKND